MVSYTLEGTRLSYNFYEMENCLLAGTFPPVPLFHIGLCICYMCYDSQFHVREKKEKKSGSEHTGCVETPGQFIVL